MATLVSAGTMIATAVQVGESVALLTAGTTQAAPASNPVQPSQLHARNPNRRWSSRSAMPSPASARAG